MPRSRRQCEDEVSRVVYATGSRFIIRLYTPAPPEPHRPDPLASV
jgi:hypothetical protein